MWNRKRRLKGAARSPEDALDAAAVNAAAVGMLARRDYGSGELAAKLREQGFADAAVQPVIAGLVEQRYIDDARYASHRVSYQAGRGHGPQRIRRNLADLGVEPPLIDEALAAWNWGQQARDVRIRKFGPEPAEDWQERARQARFLQYRGFSADHIRSALGASDLDLDS